tara:strand:- start:12001 stop:12735 length:735 start_codon:yes stop_codon:yes gene_type:complete
MAEVEKVRINKFLTQIGFCSRRAADKLIEARRVTINGAVPELGTKISTEDLVEVDGEVVSQPKAKKNVYIAFNKPVGIVCTTETEKEPDNIIDYIGYPERIFPIGRLDKPSEGLIFLTNDGDIVNKILRARNNHEKEYIVTVNRDIDDDFIHTLSNGVPILDQVTKKCKVDKLDDDKFRIILTQGLNRQIRRMVDFTGLRVRSLKRVRIMNVKLDISPGKWRHLTEEELTEIYRLSADSEKTPD